MRLPTPEGVLRGLGQGRCLLQPPGGAEGSCSQVRSGCTTSPRDLKLPKSCKMHSSNDVCVTVTT